MIFIKTVIIILIILLSRQVYANIEVHSFENRKQEQTYNKLVNELRCLVCQNQNLADSNADLAKDLRNKIVKMIDSGKSEQQIIEYVVNRYGDFVLYRPPLNKRTWLLWFGPFIILLVGIITLLVFVKRHKNKTAPDLSEGQKLLVSKLLAEENDE